MCINSKWRQPCHGLSALIFLSIINENLLLFIFLQTLLSVVQRFSKPGALTSPLCSSSPVLTRLAFPPCTAVQAFTTEASRLLLLCAGTQFHIHTLTLILVTAGPPSLVTFRLPLCFYSYGWLINNRHLCLTGGKFKEST